MEEKNKKTVSVRILSPRHKMSPRNWSRQSNVSTSSRQSSISSALSTVTSEEESLASSEIVPCAGRRFWAGDVEMERSLKILKQKQAATARLRRVNDVHSRILEGKIRLLDTKFQHVSRELLKETRSLQEEVDGPETVASPLRLPRINSATTATSRSSSSLSGLPRETVCQTCIFQPSDIRSRCKHFPCFLPRTYNSLGVFPKPQTYSAVSNYKQLLGRCRDMRPPTSLTRKTDPLTAPSLVEEVETTGAPRTTIKEKIRGLRQLVKEMKERNEKTKPKDWAINYGEPMPRRILLNPVKVAC